MKWEESIAAKCRWSEYAAPIIGDADILWENSENNYQGHADLFAHPRYSEDYIIGGWSYGSCSGCDQWEDQPSNQVAEEMAQAFRTLRGKAALLAYVEGLEKEHVPKYDYGGVKAAKIKAMRKAFD